MFIGLVNVNVTENRAREVVLDPAQCEISFEAISLTVDSTLNNVNDLNEFVPSETAKKLSHVELFHESFTGKNYSSYSNLLVSKTFTNFSVL